MTKKQKQKLKFWTQVELAVLDVFILTISYFVIFWIANQLGYSVEAFKDITISLILILVSIGIFVVLGLYRIIITHFGFEDVLKIAAIVVVKNVAFLLFFLLNKQLNYIEPVVFILLTPLEVSLIILSRAFPKTLRYFRTRIIKNHHSVNTLIVGAGSGGTIVLKEINQNPERNNKVVGFVDDDEVKIGSRLNGIKVYGPIRNIVEIIKMLEVEEVIIAIANISPKALSGIVKELTQINVKSRRIRVLSEVDSNQPVELVDVKIEDLLKRTPVELDNEGLSSFLKDQVILVTGGGGSIGSELCRQIIQYNPKRLIIFDIYENSTYDIQMELIRKFYKESKQDKLPLEVVIGSVYNKKRLKEVFANFKPDIVFHAAAYKHVPLMEDSAVEAIRTNIIGTYNIAELSNVYKVKKVVLVSTDKAVRPANIMGATKRYAEHIVQYWNSVSKNTSYSAVRFGNVLGSNGSVIPLFQKQIADGGPLTVTHKEITRFFMTISEAVSLILLSGVYAKGSEIFVLDMGEPVKILDLAESMIRLAGYRPYTDVDIVFTGLRPGEKLYEEILLDGDLEKHKPTANDKIFIENASFLNKEELRVDYICEVIDTLSNKEAKTLIKDIIKTYKNSNH